MGSKGSNQVSQNQTQSYTPTSAIAGAGNQAIGMAQTAAQAPFQMPAQPIAGFSPDQLAAFQAINQAQGMAQPYFQQGANYINQSAQPLTADQINNFYNPMASNVFAALNNSQAQQMQETTGQLTQAAGGIGADRIAVGQGELAKQQQLAQGQTAAGLYQSALQAAQQNQQMQAGAGYGLANIGAGAQGAQLQGIQAQLGTGGLQQQLQQAQLNSPYQQQLAQIAYPFQTAQYLAGVTGGLSGAMGGTTTGTGTTTYPAPSMVSQIAGAGIGAAGLLKGLAAFGGGGRVGYAGGGDVSYQGPYAPYMAGSPSIVPAIPMQMGNMSHPVLPPAPTMPQQQQQQNPFAASAGFLGALKNTGAFGDKGWAHYSGPSTSTPTAVIEEESAGGAVNPFAPMQGYADGGDAENYVPLYAPNANGDLSPEAIRTLLGGQMQNSGPLGQMPSPGPASFDARFGNLPPARDSDLTTFSVPRSNGLEPLFDMSGARKQPDESSLGLFTGNVPSRMMTPSAPPEDAYQPLRQSTPQSPYAPSPVSSYASMPESEKPYPRALEENVGTNLARSPWLALAQAGFGMMAGTSPYAGVNIGKGAMEGVKELQTQRAEAQKEESANQRAKQLWTQAQEHLKTFQHSEDVLKETARQHDALDEYRKAQIEHMKNLDEQGKILPQLTPEGNLIRVDKFGNPQVMPVQAQPKQGAANKIDQAIVNEIEKYPDLKQSDLGYLPAPAQTQLKGAFASASNLESIAKFAKENPDSFGLIARLQRDMNLDALQGAMKSSAVESKIDSLAANKQIDGTTAAKAKILNKMLTTQAFADAAASGARGGTVFLDRAFKEIYDQSSSPEAFFGVLQKRYEDADRIAKQYKMGFDNRKDLDEHPFWKEGASGYIKDIRGSQATKGKPAAPVQVSTPEEASKLKPGTHYITPDGREIIR